MLKKVKSERVPVEVPSAAVPVVAGYRVRGGVWCGRDERRDGTPYGHAVGMGIGESCAGRPRDRGGADGGSPGTEEPSVAPWQVKVR